MLFLILLIFLINYTLCYKLKYKENAMGKFYYFENEKYIGDTLNKGIIWESHLLNIVRKYVEKSEVILDIGCHVGTHSISYSNINPNVKIYCFEPSPPTYEVLIKNIEHNNLTNSIFPDNKAVGHKFMKVQMNNHIGNELLVYDVNTSINYGGLNLGIGGDIVDMINIDEYFLDKNLNINYIKIDVEGAEKLVILGAKKIIEKYRPVILYEKNHRVITKDMISMMNLTNTEIEFNIENYLISIDYTLSFKYADVLAIPN